MAILKNGLMGSFSGAVGPIVGGTWKGISYIRSKPAAVKKRQATPAQIAQQQKFRVAACFANDLTTLLDITFRSFAVNKTGRNCAISYLLKRAVSGSSPAFMLDYPQVLISRGDLLSAAEAVMTEGTDKHIVFTWTDNSGSIGAKASDRAIIVVHCPELNKSLYGIMDATRSSCSLSLDASAFSGRTVHGWLGFISKNSKEVADSVYAGAVDLV